MSLENLQTWSNAVVAVGIILTALGGWGSYYFGKRLEKEEKRKSEAIESKLNEKIDTLVAGNESMQRRLEPFERLATQRYPNLATDAALNRLASEVAKQRDELTTIQQYSEVSKLNFAGVTGVAGAGLSEQTAISRILDGSYTVEGNILRYRCDDAAIEKFRRVVMEHPRFPFGYYALAYCLRQRGESSWRQYAESARAILEKTTSIDGHHRNHDQALKEVKASLAG